MTNDDFFDFKLVTWVEAKMPERKKPNLNANTNPSANPDASVNTAESAQIQTEAQEAAENANVQTTEVDKNTQGTEKVSAVEQSAENKNASAKTEVARDIQRADDQKCLKDQIKDNQEKLNKINPVSEVEVDDMSKMNKTEKTAYILGMYGKAFKNGIERSDVGFIEIGKKQIKAAYKYLHTDAEYMALATVPDVVAKGKIVTERADHKKRGYPTITIAAPVVINGVRGNMAVTIQKTEQTSPRYKVHRILMPDGTAFTLPTAEAEPTTLVRESKIDSENSTISSASNNSIAEKEKTVNPSNEKTSTKRSISAEEDDPQRKEAFDALLKTAKTL